MNNKLYDVKYLNNNLEIRYASVWALSEKQARDGFFDAEDCYLTLTAVEVLEKDYLMFEETSVLSYEY